MQTEDKTNEIMERFIKDLGLDILPEAEKQDILLQASDIVFGSVLGRCTSAMSKEDNEKLENMLKEEKDPGSIKSFLIEKNPNFFDIMAEEFNAYKDFVYSKMN